MVVRLGGSVDSEDGASGSGEVEGGDDLLAAAVLGEAALLREGGGLATGDVMGWPGLADVAVVGAWRIEV